MTESYMVPEFDENGRFLSDKVNARIVDMIKAHAPEAPSQASGPVVVHAPEGDPNFPETLVEPLPENLPIGTYFVVTNPVLGRYQYRLTPTVWLPECTQHVYYHYLPDPGDGLHFALRRDYASLPGAWAYVSTSLTDNIINFEVAIYAEDLKAGDVLSLFMEGPHYPLVSNQCIGHNTYTGDGFVPEVYPVIITSSGENFDGTYVKGTDLMVKIPSDRTELHFRVQATLVTPTVDLTATDRSYTYPSDRVTVEVPEPVFEADENGTKGTITIPSVEGVTWHATFKGWGAPEDIVEPGTHEVSADDNLTFTVTAVSSKGYAIADSDPKSIPWRSHRQWNYRLGLPINLPVPTVLEATTKDDMTGWIVRFPAHDHGYYMATTIINPDGTQTVSLVTGDVFVPNGGRISWYVNPPYYLPDDQTSALFLNADGTFTDGSV